MRFANWDELAKLAKCHQPKKYLEVGVMDGGSLVVVLENCTPKTIALCDMWDPQRYRGHSYRDHSHITRLLKDRHYDGKVLYFDGDSHKILPMLQDSYDLIHVDGDHSVAGAMQDLEDCWKLLPIGGHLVFDDIQRPELLEVLKRFRLKVYDECSVVTLELDKPDGVATLRKVEKSGGDEDEYRD